MTRAVFIGFSRTLDRGECYGELECGLARVSKYEVELAYGQ